MFRKHMHEKLQLTFVHAFKHENKIVKCLFRLKILFLLRKLPLIVGVDELRKNLRNRRIDLLDV